MSWRLALRRMMRPRGSTLQAMNSQLLDICQRIINTMIDIQKELAPFPLVFEIEVQWGDMDAGMHVNNLIYMRWAETARTKYFIGLDYPVISDGKLPGFILGYQDCKYLFPVKFPDTAVIGVRAKDLSEFGYYLETHIYSKTHKRLVAINNAKVVCFDYKAQKKVALSDQLKEKIAIMEGWVC